MVLARLQLLLSLAMSRKFAEMSRLDRLGFWTVVSDISKKRKGTHVYHCFLCAFEETSLSLSFDIVPYFASS